MFHLDDFQDAERRSDRFRNPGWRSPAVSFRWAATSRTGGTVRTTLWNSSSVGRRVPALWEHPAGSSSVPIGAGHAVLESYSVLERLRRPSACRPVDAQDFVPASFVNGVSLVSADSRLWERLETLRKVPSAGGRAYDALIAALPRKGSASTILTFNPRHLEGLDGTRLKIAVPGEVSNPGSEHRGGVRPAG